MTLIQEKIDELKYQSAKQFSTTVFELEGVRRYGKNIHVSDARKCVAVLYHELYPEVKEIHISKSLKKTKGAVEKMHEAGRSLYKTHMGFKHNVDSVRKAIEKNRDKGFAL